MANLSDNTGAWVNENGVPVYEPAGPYFLTYELDGNDLPATLRYDAPVAQGDTLNGQFILVLNNIVSNVTIEMYSSTGALMEIIDVTDTSGATWVPFTWTSGQTADFVEFRAYSGNGADRVATNYQFAFMPLAPTPPGPDPSGRPTSIDAVVSTHDGRMFRNTFTPIGPAGQYLVSNPWVEMPTVSNASGMRVYNDGFHERHAVVTFTPANASVLSAQGFRYDLDGQQAVDGTGALPYVKGLNWNGQHWYGARRAVSDNQLTLYQRLPGGTTMFNGPTTWTYASNGYNGETSLFLEMGDLGATALMINGSNAGGRISVASSSGQGGGLIGFNESSTIAVALSVDPLNQERVIIVSYSQQAGGPVYLTQSNLTYNSMYAWVEQSQAVEIGSLNAAVQNPGTFGFLPSGQYVRDFGFYERGGSPNQVFLYDRGISEPLAVLEMYYGGANGFDLGPDEYVSGIAIFPVGGDVPPDPEPACFWTDLMNVAQECSDAPDTGCQPAVPEVVGDLEMLLQDVPGFDPSVVIQTEPFDGRNSYFGKHPEDEVFVEADGRIRVTSVYERGDQMFSPGGNVIPGNTRRMVRLTISESEYTYSSELTRNATFPGDYLQTGPYISGSGLLTNIAERSGTPQPGWQFGVPNEERDMYGATQLELGVEGSMQSATYVAAPTRMVVSVTARYMVEFEPPRLAPGYYRDVASDNTLEILMPANASDYVSLRFEVTPSTEIDLEVNWAGDYQFITAPAGQTTGITMTRIETGGTNHYITLYDYGSPFTARVAVLICEADA